MTHDQLCALERITERSFNALSTFADREERAQMAQALHLVSRIRAASHLLCDPGCTEEERQDATETLLHLFKE